MAFYRNTYRSRGRRTYRSRPTYRSRYSPAPRRGYRRRTFSRYAIGGRVW